jgi:cytoskeletal protein CcmA (bactofilin family)
MLTTKRHVNATNDRLHTVTSAPRNRLFLAAAILLMSLVDAPMPVPRHIAGPSVATAVTVSDAPVADFEVIREGELSLSRMPQQDIQWQSLLALGVNSIVNLDGRRVDVAQFGFGSFLWTPLRDEAVPTSEDAERFLTFIQQADNQPAHIVSVNHHRRGVMVALLRYAIDGWAIEQALAEAQRLSKGGLTPQQVAWLLCWAQGHPSGSHRFPAVADFEVIWEGQLSTSRTPERDSQWLRLLALGVNSIVILDSEMVDVAQFGFASFLWTPLRDEAQAVPTLEDAGRFLTFIQQADNQPAHIVSAGRHRLGVMVALLRYAIEGRTIEQALAEGQRVSGGGLTPEQIAWLRGWAQRHPPGSHHMVGPMWAGEVKCSTFGGVIGVHVNADVIADVNCTVRATGSVAGNVRADGTSVTVQGRVNGNIEQKGAQGVTVAAGGRVGGNIKEEDAGEVSITVTSGGSFNGNTEELGDGSVSISVAEGHFYAGNANEKGDGSLTTCGAGRFNGNTKEEDAGVCVNTIANFNGNACE